MAEHNLNLLGMMQQQLPPLPNLQLPQNRQFPTLTSMAQDWTLANERGVDSSASGSPRTTVSSDTNLEDLLRSFSQTMGSESMAGTQWGAGQQDEAEARRGSDETVRGNEDQRQA
ncbi:hypothetical protein BT69DRAFT_1283079 [Atractiella rhizophila]|nr:hypothetical protein BT69DRAFT_1283079 [Atractiella rhizophila]